MLGSIRFILICIHVIFTFTIGTLLCLVRPFHKGNMKIISTLFAGMAFRILGINYIIRGKEYLDNRPCVFISNHQGNLDIAIGAKIMPYNTASIGKKSLLYIPFFGQFYWLAGNVLIDRKNKVRAKQSMMNITKKIIEDKKSLWILPEGTRGRGRGLLPFKQGGFMTAINAKVPVVSICWSNYYGKMKWNQWCPGTIIAEILPPVKTDHLKKEDSKQLAADCNQVMKDVIERLDAEIG